MQVIGSVARLVAPTINIGFRQVAGLSAQFGKIFAVLAIVFLLIALLAGRGPALTP